MRKLKLHQYNVISRFCEDLAKGLMLATALGQAIVVTNSVLGRILSVVIAMSVALLLLFLAVYFSKREYGK